MFSGLLQDWTTIDGAGTAPSVQTRTDWLDLALFADVVLWLEVRSVTKPGAGDVVLTYETSPCTDDSIFQPLGTVTLAASSTPVITQVKLSANPLIPLGRYVRWKLAGTATGNWSGTFRVFAMANRGSSGATFTPATLAGLVGWYDSETNESPGTNNGAVDSLGDQSAAGNNIAGTSPNRPVWRSGQFAAGDEALDRYNRRHA